MLLSPKAQEKLSTFGTAFLDAFEIIHEAGNGSKHIEPRRLTITMITFVATLSEALSQKFLGELAATIACGGGGIFRLAGNLSLVAGCKSIMLRDSSTCATTQIFHSGRVQIAGCASQIEMAALMQELLGLMNRPGIVVEDFDTHLVNLNVGLGKSIRIGTLGNGRRFVDLLNEQLLPLNDYRRAEKRENYAPVTIVLPAHISESKGVTCQLFASGSLQISGPTAKDVAVAYSFVVSFLEKHASLVLQDLTTELQTDDRLKNTRCWSELVRRVCPAIAHTHLPVRSLVAGCDYCRLFGNVFAV